MTGIRIGRVFGIEIAVHPSWFVILTLLTFTLATGFFPRTYEGWGLVTTWTVALSATLLLFVSVLAHEFGHSLVAKAQGIPVKSITLFLLGGVASLEREASSPGREAVMAAAGPLVSLTIGAASWGVAWVLPGPQQVEAVLLYLGVANLALAIFNLLPGFPLDGGRVLRALLWWRARDFTKATRQAAAVGQVVASGFIVLGVLQVLFGAGLGGLWLALIGWILIQAARAGAEQAVLEQSLAGVTAARLMTRPSGWLSPYVTLSWASQDHFTDYESRCVPVRPEDPDHEYDGLVCATDLESTPKTSWDRDRVRDVMTPADQLPTVAVDTPAVETLRLLRRRRADRAVVVDAGGRLVGYIDGAAVTRFALRRPGGRTARHQPRPADLRAS